MSKLKVIRMLVVSRVAKLMRVPIAYHTEYFLD